MQPKLSKIILGQEGCHMYAGKAELVMTPVL